MEPPPGRRADGGSAASVSPSLDEDDVWIALGERLGAEPQTDAIRAQLSIFHFHHHRLELGLALLEACDAKTRARVLLGIAENREETDVRLKWMCLNELQKTQQVPAKLVAELERELHATVEGETGGVSPSPGLGDRAKDEGLLLSSLAQARTQGDRRRALSAILATGSEPLIRKAEAAEDKRHMAEHPEGLMAYLRGDGTTGWEERSALLLQLTRLHSELLHGSLLQTALRDKGRAKEVLRDNPELKPLFLALLWDQAEDLGELSKIFAEFSDEDEGSQDGGGEGTNTVTKLWRMLEHRLLLSGRLKRRVTPSDTMAQVLSEDTLDLVESWPTFNSKQRVLLTHDLNVYHIQGYTQSFLRDFALTNVCFEGGEGPQEEELTQLLVKMRSHADKVSCSFSLTWMAWFAYVFLNSRYHENMSAWRSYASALYKTTEAGPNQKAAQTALAVAFFDSAVTLIEDFVSASEALGIDGDYVAHVLTRQHESAESEAEIRGVLDEIVSNRQAALRSFVDQARWRLNIVRRMLGKSATWPEIFKILHATPISLLQICRSYNEYGLCDETVEKYDIPESEASSMQLAEWIDGLATRISVDGMITGLMQTDTTAAEEFETYVDSMGQMEELDKVLLYLDVGTAVATAEEISLRMLGNAEGILRRIEVTEENDLMLGFCRETMAALSGVSEGEVRSIPKVISSADVGDRCRTLGAHVKAVRMLTDALQCAKEGKRQFLSGVLHNICRALSTDSRIERESFRQRLQSAGLLLPLLRAGAPSTSDGAPPSPPPPHAQFLSSFISYLAHIGDAIASVDSQDTYNHFNLLARDPRDILMYILFERKDPKVATRIAKLLHTNLIDEVLNVCVPRVFPPLSGHASSTEAGPDAPISKRDWDKSILVLKSLVEKAPLRIALACLYISYRESRQETDILAFTLDQLSAYPTLHRWIKIQFFIQQMRACISSEETQNSNPNPSLANSTVLEANFEIEHAEGALRGCLWEDMGAYDLAIERMRRSDPPKLREAVILSDRCFQEGSSDGLLMETIEGEAAKGEDVFDFALRIQEEDKIWECVEKFKGTWGLDDLTLLTLKCASVSPPGSEIHSRALGLLRRLKICKRVLVADQNHQGRWQEIETQCADRPEKLLRRLSSLGAHELVSEIAREFGADRRVLHELGGEGLLTTLSERSVDGGGVPGVIRRLAAMERAEAACVAFWALKKARDVASKKVFLAFLTAPKNRGMVGTTLGEEERSYVSRVNIGAEILLGLPNPLAWKFESLVEHPELILENLIISLEIPTAKKICASHPKLISNERIAFYAYKGCCFAEAAESAKVGGGAASGEDASPRKIVFPMLESAGDDHVRRDYHYEIAPSIPLCEAILELSPTAESAALNALRVAIRLAAAFLNEDLHSEATARAGVPEILEYLERTETILEITDKAKACFERTCANQCFDFKGWEPMWDEALSDATALDFDLTEAQDDGIAGSGLEASESSDSGGLAHLERALAHLSSFAVRLELIHTLLSHEVAVSFRSFGSKEAIERAVDFIGEEEHYNIAIFVSNKFGLDPSRIWEAWGLGLLNLSEYGEARVKLERAIKTSEGSEGSLRARGKGRAAQIALRAVETLEKGKMVDVAKIYEETHRMVQERDIKTKGWFGFGQASAKTGAASSGSKTVYRNFSSSQVESEAYAECHYYVRSYAPRHLLEFYFKHKQYQKACLLALETKSSDHIESLSKSCVRYGKEETLVDFFRMELGRESDDKTEVIGLLAHAIEVVASCKQYALAHRLQMLESRGTLAAVLALRAFKECGSRREAEVWLQTTMDQILEVSGGEQQETFESLGIACDDLGVGNLLEMRSIVALQIDVMKFAEKTGSDFKSWDIVGSNDMIAFHRRRAAELLLLRDGNLSFRIIQEFRLPAAEVYIDAIRRFCKNKKQIGQLIPLVRDLKGTLGDLDWDHVILEAFFVLLNESGDRSRAKQMMKVLVSDHAKVLALIGLGKLEKAFELAKASADEVDVAMIAKHARSKGNNGLRSRCEAWIRDRQA